MADREFVLCVYVSNYYNGCFFLFFELNEDYQKLEKTASSDALQLEATRPASRSPL